MLIPTNLSKNHTIAVTAEDLAAMVRELREQTTIAFDFETAGLRWWDRQLPIGVAMGYQSSDGPRCWYVPVAHRTLDVQADLGVAQRAFADALANADALVGHNLKFDLNQGRAGGWSIPPWTTIHDTMIQGVLIDETKPKGLEKLVAAHGCSPYGDSFEMKNAVENWIRDRCKAKRQSRSQYLDECGHAEVPVALEGEYACRDIGHTLALHRAQFRGASGGGQPWEAQRNALYANEMLLVRALADMEFVGQRVDTAYLERVKLQITGELETIGDVLKKGFGTELTWNNDRVVRDLIYGDLGLKPARYTKSGKPSVDKAALLEFAASHPAIEPLMEWRARYKILTTYTDSLIEKTDAHGRVHPQFNQGGAASGRLSSSAPNFQNIPSRHPVLAKLVRRAFICDPGKARVYCDYSQIELRMLAWISNNETLLSAYQSDAYDRLCAGLASYEAYRTERQSEDASDIHGLVARRVFGAEPSDADWKRKRSASKIINFGVPYGGGPALLMGNPELRMTENTAKAYYNAYHAANPEIEQTRRRLLRKMRDGDLSFTNWASRQRHGYRLDWADEELRAEEERSMFACLVQGSAAELTRYSIVRVWLLQQRGELPAVMTSTVHDEIQVDCDVADVADVARTVQREMESFTGLFGTVPVIADIETTITNWAEKEEWTP